MMLRERSKPEYKVSGSRTLHSGRSGSMSDEMKTWGAAQKLCAEAASQKGQQMEIICKKSA